ncbi:MAG: cell division protein FtsA [Bacteroidales bacterium]|nr:cell division protein FtsA [Bacteroidales bacterium]
MENNGIIAGLDIGTTKIAAIVGKQNKYGKIEILGYGKADSIGVNRGIVSNIEKTVESIQLAIDEAERTSNVEINNIYVGIAGQHIKSLQHRGSIMRNSLEDEISQRDIDILIDNMYKLVMQPGEEIIDVIPQEYIVDDEPGIREPIGMSGIHLEANFHIIAGQIAAAKNIHRCVNKTNITVEDLVLEPIASADAVLSDEEKEAGVALIDIGGGTTDLAIFQDGIIRHTAVIPLGGNIVTEDIKQGCSIIKNQAEALKIRFGSALSRENREEDIVSIPGLRGRAPKEITLKNLASIIEARMEEIIGQAYYEIKNSGFDKKLIAGIVLTGGGSQLKHIAQLTEFLTGKDTRIGYPNEHFANTVTEELCSPIYATGVGLVIQGIKKSEKQQRKNNVQGRSKPKKTKLFEKISLLFEEDGVK